MQRVLLCTLQQVDARGEDGTNGIRHGEAFRRFVEAPLVVAMDEHRPVDQGRQHLLDEERIPFGDRDDSVANRGIELLSEQAVDEHSRVVVAQRF